MYTVYNCGKCGFVTEDPEEMEIHECESPGSNPGPVGAAGGAVGSGSASDVASGSKRDFKIPAGEWPMEKKEGHEGAVEREYEKLWAAGVAESLKERETHLRCWRGEHEATTRDDGFVTHVCIHCRSVFVPR